MNILNSILEKIFPHAHAKPQGTPSPLTPTPAMTPAQAPVDVEEVMRGYESRSGQHLDWRHSIVDLMKLTGLDSSLAARKQLAQELHFTGNMNDSAQMNMWLHEQVLNKIKENGGKIPEDLKH